MNEKDMMQRWPSLFPTFAAMNLRQLFLQHVAQTSPAPLALEIEKAEGCWLYGAGEKKYLDLIGGISVANTGHRHPYVVAAIKQQADQYLHILVYGEMVERPQVLYAQMLTQHLPPALNSVYFTNSGAEATEGAMKLAKRVTGRTGIIACHHAYHGSTQGALSLIGSEYFRNAFRPLLPGIDHITFNEMEGLERINRDTACVVIETVQGEAGVVTPEKEWIKALQKRCNETGTLLVLDEIQAGFGRTGTLWAFEQYDIEPDILLLGKALGGGLPLGAFIAPKELMDSLTHAPVLGHITTFGGHPLSCAAGMAAFKALLQENLVEGVHEKAAYLKERLQHKRIVRIRSAGLWMAVEFDSFTTCKAIIDRCLEKGLLTDWFLFAENCMRISPPLTISFEELELAADIILQCIDG